MSGLTTALRELARCARRGLVTRPLGGALRGQATTEYVLVLALVAVVFWVAVRSLLVQTGLAGDMFIDKLIFRFSNQMREFHFPGAFTHF